MAGCSTHLAITICPSPSERNLTESSRLDQFRDNLQMILTKFNDSAGVQLITCTIYCPCLIATGWSAKFKHHRLHTLPMSRRIWECSHQWRVTIGISASSYVAYICCPIDNRSQNCWCLWSLSTSNVLHSDPILIMSWMVIANLYDEPWSNTIAYDRLDD